jgi:hypothetical protein
MAFVVLVATWPDADDECGFPTVGCELACTGGIRDTRQPSDR